LRLVYAGTSSFAVPSLEALAAAPALHDIVLVLTRPDRPAGRGRQITASPVHQAADRLGLPVEMPERASAPATLERLAALAPDLIVVASFGELLKPAFLALPRLGCVNLHASLLPRWRGASPVTQAILAGDAVTGVTLMRMDAGLDTGPILASVSTAVNEEEDCGELTARLARLAADLLIKSLPALATGALPDQPQDARLSTRAPMLETEDGRIDWSRSAPEIARQVRACTPKPGAFTEAQGRRLLVRRARAVTPPAAGGAPGEVGAALRGDGVPVACGHDTALLLLRVQPEGRAPMSAEDAARGRLLAAGMRLGLPSQAT